MKISPQAALLLNDRNLQIGNICFQWAHLEFLLALTIQSLLGVDKNTGEILTGGLDMLPRTSQALALAYHLCAPKHLVSGLKDVRADLQDRKNLLERRNRAIHGHRSFIEGSPEQEIFKTTRGRGAGDVPQTNADLAQIGKDIAASHKVYMQVLHDTGVLDAEARKPARLIARKAPRKTGPSVSTPGS